MTITFLLRTRLHVSPYLQITRPHMHHGNESHGYTNHGNANHTATRESRQHKSQGYIQITAELNRTELITCVLRKWLTWRPSFPASPTTSAPNLK